MNRKHRIHGSENERMCEHVRLYTFIDNEVRSVYFKYPHEFCILSINSISRKHCMLQQNIKIECSTCNVTTDKDH